MDVLSFIITFLIYLLVASPVCEALHELGHASMILLLTEQKVTFQFGVRGTEWKIQLGRLTILLYMELNALFFCRYRLENNAALSRHQDFGITVGGPFSSLLFTVLCGILWVATNGAAPWTGLAAINLVIFLNSSIPRYYPRWQGAQAGIPNDGLQLVRLIRQVQDMDGISRR